MEILGLAFEQGSSSESQVEELSKFVEENGINYTILYGGSIGDVQSRLPSLEDFRGFPTTIFVGRDGIVSSVDIGFSDEKAAHMEHALQELLEAKSDSEIVHENALQD